MDDRSLSPPVHVHLGRKTPVHLHMKPCKRLSRLEMQERSCSAMSAGRPVNSSKHLGLRASRSPSRSNRSMKVFDSAAMGSSKVTSWVPPPAKSSKCKMAWEGCTHRLEIHPDPSNSTVLHLSDLSDDYEETVLPAENAVDSIADEYQLKMKALQAEMDGLKAKVDLEKSMRELEEKETTLRDTHANLKKKEAELSTYKGELLDSELENLKLKVSLSRQGSPDRSARLDYDENQRRDEMLMQLATVENESAIVMNRANKVKSALKKLQKDRRFVSVHASQLLENKDIFLESLSQLEAHNKTLRRMILEQRMHQASLGQAREHRDILQHKLVQSEGTNHVLREQLEEQEKLLGHSQQLHDEIGEKEGEIQTLNIRLQSMEEQLHGRQLECSRLQGSLAEGKEQWHKDKDALKKAVKHLKEKLAQKQLNMDCLAQQLQDANAELFHEKAKVTKVTHDEMTRRKEMATLKSTVLDLEASLAQSRLTGKTSIEAITAQLTEKTHALNGSRCEVDRLQSVVSSLEARFHTSDNNHLSKVSGLESDISTLKGRVTHYEEMLSEYKVQLGRSRAEQEEMAKELRHKEQELERYKHDSMVETEKCRLKLQQQLAELEPMPELLKNSEQRLSDAQERLMMQDQRSGEQSRHLADLKARMDQNAATIDTLKERLQTATADKRALEVRLAAAEQRQHESEEQSREMMNISGRKEEVVQRLQARVEELVQEVATLSAQLEAARADTRRQLEQAKDRATGKERTHLTRISDLESQLGRANNLATQFRKSKDDLDRRYHSRVHELTDRLEQAHSTKRSLENYITFLKSSYASVFSEGGCINHAPGSPIPPPTFTH